MEINKQLFEDVLSGKLKGTFVLRDGKTFNSKCLKRTNGTFLNRNYYYPYALIGYINDGTLFTSHYTENGIWNRWSGVSSIDIIDFMPDTDMKENELVIEIPDGKIVDWEESKKQNKIVLKDKQLTYEDVCRKLYNKNKGYSYINSDNFTTVFETFAPSKDQLECILAKNKLATVANYLNDGWEPNKGDTAFAITYRGNFDNEPTIGKYYFGCGENLIVFRTQKTAQQAIDILGEETIKLALEPLGV